MELANIETLLEKYLNAETTLQEERLLRAYFSSNNVAPHLEEYRLMFNYFQQSKNETFTKTIKLKSEKTPRKLNFKWLSVAASLALLVSVFFGKQAYTDYQNEQEAKRIFAEVKRSLEKVSFNLNKGNDELYTVSSNLSKGSHAITQLDTYETTVNKVIKHVKY